VLFWITIILFCVYVGMELFLLATRRGRKSAKRGDRGTLQAAWILIAGGCIAGFYLATVFPALNWPHNVVIIYLADLLLIAGILVRIWAIRHLGKLFTVDVGIQPGHHVVQDGPFRFVRHPSYSGSFLAWIGVGFLTRNWFGFFVIVICTFVAYALRISAEEKVLREQFGEEYAKYAARTKKLVPGVY
jgi:protein-S-isoprenylcysteine O-methyltransferase Ste14